MKYHHLKFDPINQKLSVALIFHIGVYIYYVAFILQIQHRIVFLGG